MLQMRDYQIDCLDRSLEHYRHGINRQLAVMATGTGKTCVAANLRSHHGFGKKILFLVHMETLAAQAAAAMQRWNPTLRVGVEMAGSYVDFDGLYPPHFIVASVPTLGRKGSDRIKRFDPFDYDCVIQDECFPSGTLVSGTPIEQMLPGMSILSFDEVREHAIIKRVLQVSKRIAPSSMVLIHSGPVTLTCTPNHPIYTTKGWRNAANLRPGDSVLLELQCASGCTNRITEGATQIQNDRESTLLDGMHPENSLQRTGGSHDRLEPDAQRQVSEQDEKDSGEAGASTSAGRERSRNDCAAVDARVCAREEGLDTGTRHLHELGVSTKLQGGYWAPGNETGDRGRWSKPSDERTAGAGPKEGINLVWTRVDSVEIQERGSDGKPDRLCSDGYVYNLEVEDTHTYFANGVLVHNCHIGMADSFKRVYDHFGLLSPNPDGLLFLGITATPNRSDGKGLRELFDMIVFDMGIQKGIADGWLCDLVGYRVNGKANLNEVKTRAGDFAKDELENAVNTPERNAIIVKEWYKVAYPKRTLAFTVDVQHALDLAAAFTAHGERAEAVWGDDPDRHQKIRDHKTGEFNILCNCNVLGIGYDDPEIQCIISAAPTKSELRYVQQVGRGTRIFPGKTECTVIDVVDNCKKHSLTTISTLLGLPKDLDLKGEKYSTAKQKLDRIAAEFPQANVQDIKSLDQLKSIAENIQLFTVNYPPEIARLSELGWRKSADGYMLAVNRDLVQVSQDLRGDWQIKGRIGEVAVDLSAQNLPGAMNVADNFILSHGGIKPILARDSRWKNDPPTQKQLGLARVLKLTVPMGCTKGQLSAAIDQRMARRA